MANAILPMPPYAWQQAQWNDFQKRVRNNNIPHAFLLAGQEGFGAEQLAIAMGQFMLCLSPADNLVCGKCRGCLLLDAGTHPDLLLVGPEEAGKQIKVDQIRDISRFVANTAQQGGYKIIVLHPAEAMNVNAANALLKNLEEPAGKTIFILVTKQISRLLPTIRSRCAKISLPVPERKAALAWLQESSIPNAEELLAESGDAPLLVKAWHESGALADRDALVTGLADIGSGRLEPMLFAKKWSNSDPLFVLQTMLQGVDSILAANLAKKSIPKAYVPLLTSLQNSATKVLFQFRDRLCIKKSQLLGPSNLNPALVIEELTLDWLAVSRSLK